MKNDILTELEEDRDFLRRKVVSFKVWLNRREKEEEICLDSTSFKIGKRPFNHYSNSIGDSDPGRSQQRKCCLELKG